MRDIFIEKCKKSDITDVLKGDQSNFCPVHFVHLFTTGAIFNGVSERYLHNENFHLDEVQQVRYY